MEARLRYQTDGYTLSELDQVLDQLWGLLAMDSSLRHAALNAGIDIASLEGRTRREAITLEREGSGFNPASTALVVAFAPVFAAVAKDLWEKVFLPRLLREKGQDSLTPKKQ